MLQVAKLRKSYGKLLALRDVDLEVPAGEIVALLGPNGAGKTTLVSIIAGLRRPDEGSVVVGGIDALRETSRARRLIGLAPQDLGIYPLLSARDNLAFFGELAGLGRKELHRRVEELAEVLSLAHLLDRQAGSLSGGERRRLHTAVALVHRPPLLLLDEPTTGADVTTRGEILELIRRVAADGSAILYSTHYMPEVDTLGASVAILDHGRLIARGGVADLVSRHGHLAVELLFDGPPPRSLQAQEVDDGLVRIPTREPASAITQTLSGLGGDAQRLRSVEIIRPSLESVFLALTGRRYESGPQVPREEPRVEK